MIKLFVDPPSGWRYGFPKECPEDVFQSNEDFRKWLLDQGYPEKDISLGIQHSRFWYEEDF